MSRWTRIVLAMLAIPSVASCSSDASTAGRRLTLHTAMNAAPSASFTTGFGWDVTLTKAVVASSAFYYFDGPPPTARYEAPAPHLLERIESLFIHSAWAHPGHYQAGTALGEAIFSEALTLDLFAPPAALPDGIGVTGTYRSARFLIPQTAPSDARLQGHLAIAEGKALAHGQADATPIYFRLVADITDIASDVTNGAVDGCVLEEADVTGDGTVTMTILPSIWLNLVDFSKLAAGSPSSPTEAHNAGFSQGVTQLSAYHFSYTK